MESLEWHERTLTIFRRLLPPDHPDIARTLAKIGGVNKRLGETGASEAARKEALLIGRRSQTACAGPGCQRRQREDGTPLTVCVACNRTHYCSVACQRADWMREGGHKAECAALVAEGRAAGGGAAK